jgi:hypothetical protein
MLIAAIVVLCAAVATAALGGWSLARPHTDDLVAQVLRAVAPTQFAAAVMLAAGGVVVLAAPRAIGLPALVVCVLGAVGTVAAGCYQSARVVAAKNATASDGCAGSCASCTLACPDSRVS